jgi:hypothetical protein
VDNISVHTKADHTAEIFLMIGAIFCILGVAGIMS